MSAVGDRALGIHICISIYSGAIFGASFVGFAGDGEMIGAAVASILCWGTLCGLSIYAATIANSLRGGDSSKLEPTAKWTDGMLTAVGITGALSAWVNGYLALATCGPLFLAPLYHWGGLLVGGIAFLSVYLWPGWVEEKTGSRQGTVGLDGWRWITVLSVYGFFAVVWIAFVIIVVNHGDKEDFLANAETGFSLPYPKGTTAWVVQGPRSWANHVDNDAYDFRLLCGTDVLAAEDGVIHKDSRHGHTGHLPGTGNNVVYVTRPGGKPGIVQYGHIKEGSMKFSPGESVRRGQKIAEVGNVGNSVMGHIHFEILTVDGNGDPVLRTSIPSTFIDADAKDHDGIPRSFLYYTSDNTRVPGEGTAPP